MSSRVGSEEGKERRVDEMSDSTPRRWEEE
jgi:hypothetical protein